MFNISKYPNLLDRIDLTSRDVEEQIVNYDIEFFDIRNRDVECGIEFPLFVPPFYDYVLKNNKIPTPEQNFKYYLKENKGFFSGYNVSDSIITALYARVMRTYPLLIRDLHFSLMCNEFEGDVDRGIDMMFVKNEKFYGVGLYTKTSRGKGFRKSKKEKYLKFKNVGYIDFPINLSRCKEIGRFLLCDEQDLLGLCAVVEYRQNLENEVSHQQSKS